MTKKFIATPVLPQAVLKRMAPSERAKLGKAGMLQSEAEDKYIYKNEKEIQGHIDTMLRRKGILFVRPRMDKKSPLPVGFPDFTLYLKGGIVIFWEVKMPGLPLRPEQKEYECLLKDLGFRHEIINSVKQALDSLGNQGF